MELVRTLHLGDLSSEEKLEVNHRRDTLTHVYDAVRILDGLFRDWIVPGQELIACDDCAHVNVLGLITLTYKHHLHGRREALQYVNFHHIEHQEVK